MVLTGDGSGTGGTLNLQITARCPFDTVGQENTYAFYRQGSPCLFFVGETILHFACI